MNHKFYRETFRRFPFENRGFQIAEFEDHNYIESEFRLDQVNFWPEGEMGRAVAQERRERERDGDDISHYFRNPKEYINRISENHLRKSSRENFLPKSVYQGAIDTLVTKARTKMDRATSNKISGSVCDLIVTYPVTLLPKSRGKLRELTEQLGYPALSVILNYDESVAPAIFYLDKYFGNFDEIGPEAFKMKCQFDQGVWSHNMLIVDIGAGTTDISLIQIEMTEKFPQRRNRLGGRSYEIMPTLLGSLGYSEMGGNLLTLKIFKHLKYILANFIEEADKENPENKPCKHGNFGFGGVLSTEDKEMLKMAEAKLPTQTRTKDTQDGKMDLTPEDLANRVRLFDYLWRWAEEIKIHYSLRLADGKCETDYNLNLYEGALGKYYVRSLKEELKSPETGQFLRSILKVNNLDEKAEQLSELLLFTQKAFLTYEEDIVRKVVKSSVDLTLEALKVRQEKLKQKSPEKESFPSCSGVNSIVLSGRTSRLVLIKDLFQKKIDESCDSQDTRPFAVPQAEIIFEDEYAKTATVTGAIRAHQIDRDSYVDVDDNPRLLEGGCSRILRVKNLLFNLPCEFYDGPDKIFTLQSEFNYMDFTDQMRLRSNSGFHTPRKGTVISQQIGERPINPLFAILRTNEISQSTEGRIDEESLRVQYEITPELIISALVARVPQGENVKKELFLWRTRKVPGLKSPQQTTISPETFSKVFSAQDKCLKTDILYTTSSSLGDANILFERGTELNKPVVNDQELPFDSQKPVADGKEQGKYLWGIWSKNPMILFKTQSLEIKFLADISGSGNQETIAIMDLSSIISQAESYKDYTYRILLTQDGILTLFVGEEPPYYETEDLKEWEKNEHMVYRKDITLDAALFDSDNNPFNGRQ